jgi:hypothetical protein
MKKLCCACHSSSIAALIYIIVVPDMHGQRVDTENYQIARTSIPMPSRSTSSVSPLSARRVANHYGLSIQQLQQRLPLR